MSLQDGTTDVVVPLPEDSPIIRLDTVGTYGAYYAAIRYFHAIDTYGTLRYDVNQLPVSFPPYCQVTHTGFGRRVEIATQYVPEAGEPQWPNSSLELTLFPQSVRPTAN